MLNEELTKLIQAAINGDTAAFEQVMQSKARQIIYISVKLMRNQQDGEDAAQDAMLKMYQHLGDLKKPEAFQSWMSQIITRTCIDMRRKQTREDHDYLESEEEINEMRREFLPQEYIEDLDKRAFLMEVIDDLPEKYRACLLFYYYEGMTHRQVAQAMGTTDKIVDNILQRARRRIRKQLDKKYQGSLTMSSFQSVVAVPVLSQLFELDALLHTSPEMATRIFSSASSAAVAWASTAGAASGGSAAGAGASTAQAVSSASTAAGTATVPTKILVGVVATVTATGGAAVALFPGNDSAADLWESPPAQEEAAILTLEDMIGTEAAQVLRGYVAGDGESGDWEGFLAGLLVTNYAGLNAEEARYTLYHLEKQDKQLFILDKRLADDELAVAFHFTDIQEEVPQRGELMRSFERWSR